MQTRKLLGVIVALGLTLSAACGGADDEGQSSKPPYVIVTSGDYTKATSAVATPIRDAIVAYFKRINAEGGINGHEIKIISLDDQGDPQLAIANVKQAVQQHRAIAITGLCCSLTETAQEPAFDQYQIAGIGQGATLSQIIPAKKWIFQTSIPATQSSPAQVSFGSTLIKSSTVRAALVTNPVPGGEEWAAKAKALAQGKGWTIVADERLPLALTDATPQARAIINANPDVILNGSVGRTVILLHQALRNRGNKTPIISHSPGSALEIFKAINDPDYYAVRQFAAFDDTSAGVQQFVADMKAAGLDPDRAFVADGYLMAWVLAEAIRECGDSCTSSSVQKALDGLSVDTKGLTNGPVTFTSSDHQGPAIAYVYAYKEGKLVRLAADLPAK